ncbi:MAG: YfiR family protein [Gammaproteobacteria bacterium]
MRREQPRGRGYRVFLSAAIGLVAYSAFASLPVTVSNSHAREGLRKDALRAGYLFNFMKFVDWPPTRPLDSFTVCFVGESGVYDELAAVLPDKRLGARRLEARRVSAEQTLSPCEVLFIDAGELAAVASSIGARPIALLTVSDAPDFLESGGIIELFDEGNRLRFRVSLENARRANLHISSSLLQLASSVERET